MFDRRNLQMNQRIYNKAVIEIISHLRTVKRQLTILKSAQLTNDERLKLVRAIDSIQEDFNIFKI